MREQVAGRAAENHLAQPALGVGPLHDQIGAELVCLGQQDLTELDCAVMVNGLVRADSLPLVFKAIGADSLPRHARVRVRITGVDLLTLDVHASVIARLDEAGATDEGDTEGEGDEEVLDNAGPLTLAIDVSDADAPTGDAPTA